MCTGINTFQSVLQCCHSYGAGQPSGAEQGYCGSVSAQCRARRKPSNAPAGDSCHRPGVRRRHALVC